MPAWIEDAQIITDLGDLAGNQHAILQRTGDIADFLTNAGAISTALVAPKGFGKTFVLKLKRVALQDVGFHCLPVGTIVDRPRDRPPILSGEINQILEKSEHWETLWQLAFSVTLAKAYLDDDGVRTAFEREVDAVGGSGALRDILRHPYIDTPLDLLHNFLSLQRSEIFQTLKEAQRFSRIFANIRRRCAVFVDNIDEYLEHYVNYHYQPDYEAQQRYLRIWHCGQIGAWLSVRRLHGINPHVRIFVSMRREAYHYAMGTEPGFANLRSFRRELRYDRADIAQIIVNNINAESKSRLVDKRQTEPMARFVGASNTSIIELGTGRLQPLMAYWLRHCSLSPRDAVAIGGEISNISPENRTPERIRAAVNRAAAERVQNLFTEVAPFFQSLFPDLLSRIIESNVLAADALSAAAERYRIFVAEEYGDVNEAAAHPFCMLYAIGLLGVVRPSPDVPGRLVQSFAPAGQIPFGHLAVLPRADTYVVHPALSDFICAKNVRYLQNITRHNVVGDGFVWQPDDGLHFVAIGDIVGFRQAVMRHSEMAQSFAAYWKETFERFAEDLALAQITDGDRFVAADSRPERLLRAIRALMAQLDASSYGLELRVGAHCGHLIMIREGSGPLTVASTESVGVAARLEPLAKAGDVVVSATFAEAAARLEYRLLPERCRPLDATYAPDARYLGDNRVVISKPHEEPPEAIAAYVVDLTKI